MKKLTKSIRSTALIAILIVTIFAVLVFNQVHKQSVRAVDAELEKCLKVSWELLRQKGAEFRIVDGKLLVDSYVINDNFEVPDKVQEIFGDVATVFMGDMRVSTNVLNADGSRALGSRLEGPAYEAIFKEGTSYRGEASILGIPYLTAYDPIRDGKGEVVGALFVGVKKVDFLSRFTEVKVQLSLLLLGQLAAFTTLMTLLWKVTKKFETKIVEQKEFAESLVNNSAVPTFVLDSQHRVIMWNKACEDLTGMKTEEMLGSENQWKPFYPEKRAVLADIVIDGTIDDLPSLYGTFSRSAITPEGLQAEGWFEALNGRMRFIFFDAEPVRNSEGKIIAAIETVQEITGRKRAEMELGESRQHLADIIQFNPDAIVVIDSGGRVNAWNRAMEELSGVRAEDMLGKGDYEYALPFYGERRPVLIDLALLPGEELEKKYAHIERRGNTLIGEACIHNARGEELCFHGTAAALRNSDGKIIGAIESIRDITAQKRAQEKVRQSEEKFRLLFEMSPYGIGVMDLDGRLQMCNRQAALMHNYEHPEEMVSLKMFDLITPESGADIAASMENLISGESQLIVKELSVYKKDGSIFLVEFSICLIRDAALHPLAFIIVGNDITERKRAEDDLRENEEKFSSITNTAQDAIVMINGDGKITFWNPAAERIFGYRSSEIMGKELHAILAPQKYHESYTKGLAQFRESGEGAAVGKTVELDAIRKGGEEFSVELSLSAIQVKSKWHAVGIMRDITRRKSAEQSLKKEKDFSQALIECMPGTFFLIDASGKIQRLNKNIENVLGFSEDEISSHSPLYFFAAQDQEIITTKIQEVFANGKAVVEANFATKDGRELPYLLTGLRIEIDDAPYLLGIGMDISERKNAEKELQKAWDAAEDANRLKSEFLANMSHEIRTPMNAAMGMLYLLQQTALTDKQKDYLGKAQAASNSLLSLINDILDFSKIEAGKMELESVSFRLSTVLNNLRDIATTAILERPVELLLVTGPDVADNLIGDPLRLGQVLLNLTSNAIKFTEQGKVIVKVELVTRYENEVELRFSVQDSGIGMSPQQQEKLFSVFCQADSSTTRKYGGTGLGLAICKQLVENMGGTIRVASEKDKGSTFSFTLRFGCCSGETVAFSPVARIETTAACSEALAGDLNFAGVRILLVEDNLINQEVAREILEIRGVKVDVAGNGSEAVARITAADIAYDAVFMDVQMPVMDGLEATRQIRSNRAFATLPIIAMTASVMASDRLLCMQAGMNDQVTKPIDVPELFATLSRWVRIDTSTPLVTAGSVVEKSPDDTIAGIDLTQAIKRLGSTAFLKKLLINFRRENTETMKNLRAALEAGDSQLAKRIVHTLKGVGGNLGAMELSGAAITLEEALRGGDEACLQSSLSGFEQKLCQIMDSICALEKAEAGFVGEARAMSPGESPVDLARIALQARELLSLLEANNMSAIGEWEHLKPLLPELDTARVDAAITCFKFGDASDILRSVVKSIGIEL